MSASGRLRVALVRGDGRNGAADGVADYTGRLGTALRAVDVEVIDTPVGAGPLGASAAARAIRGRRPDLVHAQFAPSAYGFAPWAGLLLPDLAPGRVPWVTTLHEYGRWSTPAWVPRPVWNRLERLAPLDRETGRMIARSRAVLVTNDVHARALHRRHGFRALHAPLVPNIVPLEQRPDRARTRRELGVAPDAALITFFGFVHPVKGLRHLVDAVAALRATHPRVHLLLLGGHASQALPPVEAAAFVAELRTRAAAQGVADAVTITGHRPEAEVSAALYASDVAAFPETGGTSTKSGALLAAFAHGLPCVVTTPPEGPRDGALVDGRTVVAAEHVRDATSLARALGRLLDDPALRDEVARGAMAEAADRRWDRLAATHLDLYRRLCTDGDRREGRP